VPDTLNRRDFVKAAGAAAVFGGCRTSPGLDLPPDDPARLIVNVGPPQDKAQPGIKPLGLAENHEGDGFLFVPAGYSPTRPASLLVLLHGAGHTSAEWSTAPLEVLFGSRNVVVLAPDSRGPTWDMMLEGFGPDVAFINKALAHTFKQVAIDPQRIALGGFSDGASYALSLGMRNGDLLNALIAFSPGFVSPGAFRGKPRIFVSHGRQDSVLPIDMASREIVPALKKRGYDVDYVEFDGDHTITKDVANQAAEWLVTGVKA
jgi:phospholipase/carboxylesterase